QGPMTKDHHATARREHRIPIPAALGPAARLVDPAGRIAEPAPPSARRTGTNQEAGSGSSRAGGFGARSQNPPMSMRPLQPGFIDLPQKQLDGYKRKQDVSELGKVLRLAQRLRDTVDRVVVLGVGGSYLAAKAIFDALCHAHHNEMPAKLRMGKPR